MAMTPSSVLANVKRLLEDEALQLHEKEKLLSEIYTYLYDLIASQERDFSGKLLHADDGAVLQFPASEISRANNLIPVR